MIIELFRVKSILYVKILVGQYVFFQPVLFLQSVAVHSRIVNYVIIVFLRSHARFNMASER